jgi:hypothetical protein
MTGNTEDISYRMELFKNSSGFKYAKVDIPEEKPKKPLKTKSKRVLSTNPDDNKTYRI